MASTVELLVAGPPLLRTKLFIPMPRAGQIARPHLIARLEQAAERKLTLLSAAAGFGKTTLLAAWLETALAGGRRAAWVSLDRRDNDPALFWDYVITGLRDATDGIGDRAHALLHASQPPPFEAILTTLLNELDAFPGDISLILDDLHVIDAPAVHDAVAFLLEHLPPNVRLVIATRADPPLPLARLRARGDLAELRAADLRFAHDEAAAFLNDAMRLDLTGGDVSALEARTEGWIAGLQLAALSMQGRADLHGFINAFAGDDRYIVDYLIAEVLQRQPEQVRLFLLETAVLDRLSGPLCDAVTGRGDGRAMLETLERDNLFVVPLDDKRVWYRYHHLFADVLRAHALEARPGRRVDLHRRAAEWFAAHEMTADAIEQAIAAQDHDMLARLLAVNAERLALTGQIASLMRWSAALPQEMVRARPRLALIRATAATRTEPNLEAARAFIAMANASIAAIEQNPGFAALDDIDGTFVGQDGVGALKGEALALTLQVTRNLSPEAMTDMAQEALTLLPPAKHQIRGLLHLIRAGIQMELTDLEAALPRLEESVAEAHRANDPLLHACILEHRGQIYAALGRLPDARRSFEESLALGLHGSGLIDASMCGPHARLAEIALEMNDLDAALERVATVIALVDHAPKRSFVLHGRAVAAVVLQVAGQGEAALAQLAEAQAFSRGVATFRYGALLAAAELTVYSRMGDLTAAQDVVRARGLTPERAPDGENGDELIAYARFLVATGAYGDAADVLNRLLPALRARTRVQAEIRALAIQAMAFDGLGKRPLALTALGRATMLSEPGRFQRVFTGEGPSLHALLAALVDAAHAHRGPAEVGSSAYLAQLTLEHPRRAETSLSRALALVEPLTPREIDVLRLIARAKRNQEIADELFISLSTVKRHIANAYGKLGVAHRTEALARARELNLL